MDPALKRAAILAGVALAVAVGGLAWSSRGQAAMPCQSPNRGFDFDTFEPENYVAVYGAAIELATAGKAVTFSYTPATGEPVDLRYQGLKSGARANRAPESASLAIPPSIYKSIAWIEANWSDADGSTPYGGVGPVLVSADCGYGIGQVTSGMGHLGVPPAREPGVPSARQAVIGTHFLFNIVAGVQILADKWNSAPAYRPIAGNGDPSALEDWYYAIWSYNGFAFSNHPLNPDRDPLRGAGTSFIYHCYDPNAPSFQDTGSGNPRFGYGDYTYPERVYGCMRFPPKVKPQAATSQLVAQGTPRFKPGDSAVVNGGGGCTNLRASPSTSTTAIACFADGTRVTILDGPQAGDGYLWWHVRTPKGDGWMADQFLAPAPPATPTPTGTVTVTPTPTKTPGVGPSPGVPPVVDPAGRMWRPQVFNMPDFSNVFVAAAFDPANFATCENEGFAGGCASMDFPTSFPLASPPSPVHRDSTPPTDPSWYSKLIGDPRFQFTGPTQVSLTAADDGTTTSAAVTVKNTGTWIAPFRVRTSDNWIVVRHPGDPPDRTLDGGIAIGKETDVLSKPPGGGTATRQKGYDSVLAITLDPSILPPGISTGTVWIEPLLGTGTPFQITVKAANLKGGSTGKTYHSVAPAVAHD